MRSISATMKMNQFLSNPNPMKLLKMEILAGRALIYTRGAMNSLRGADGFVITWEGWYFRVAIVQGYVQLRATGLIEKECQLPVIHIQKVPMNVRHAFAGWIHMKFLELTPNITIYKQNSMSHSIERVMADPVIKGGGNSTVRSLIRRVNDDSMKVESVIQLLILDGKLEGKFYAGDELCIGAVGNGYAPKEAQMGDVQVRISSLTVASEADVYKSL